MNADLALFLLCLLLAACVLPMWLRGLCDETKKPREGDDW